MAAQFTRYLESAISPIPGISTVILPLDLRARKTLLSILRCQSVPTLRSKLVKQVLRGYPEYYRPVITTRGGECISLNSIVESLAAYIVHPIPNGFLQMVTKTLPLERDDVDKAIMEGFAKEITASQERRFTPLTNISSVLSPFRKDRRTTLLVGWNAFNPEIHDYIFQQLMRVSSLLTDKPYYPNYGHKLLPQTSLSNFRQLQESYGYRFEESTCGVEAFYSREGILPDGPTEMKQSFGYNDLRPRIYFSRGSTHYAQSKYIQEVFNRILEGFPCVHKFERFHISKLEIQDGEIFMVYDFSTFTTNLQSLSGFLYALADLYSHLEITVIDTFQGPVTINLGEYIRGYTAECNDSPRFETFYGSTDGEPITYTSGAGLLGIPGNISSSTLWHAVILMCLIESIALKVVGDDAGAVLPAGDTPGSLVSSLNMFGDVSMPKTEAWAHVDIMEVIEKVVWQYVKRQIYRLGNKIHCGETPMQFPNPSLFIERFADEFHAVKQIDDPILSSIKCSNRFVKECARFSLEEQGDEIIEMCRRYHNFILKEVRKDDDMKQQKQIPRFPFFQDVVDYSFESWYAGLPGLVRIPEFASSENIPEQWVTMKYYHISMKKAVRLIVDMEYGAVKMKTRVVKNNETRVLREFFESRMRPLYLFVIYESCPQFMIDLLPTCDSSPDDDGLYYTNPTSLPSEIIDVDNLFD